MNSTFSQQRAGQNALAFAGIQETLPATYHLIASLSRSKGDFNLGTIRDSLEEIQRLAWKEVNSMDMQSLKSAAIAIGQWYKNATTEIFQVCNIYI
ncbi:hypothetical protein SARC_16185 [Sphaeroforma arctica JP610]|uniref:Uncharacterized protein n=1 Tax=Sphaeroforma arctica JP610 TaxID=667725 RepID=A0A0L0F3T2_9EUKA|nr:hypothetical protein SARC_16185 [Sphaeroforma arctica JP610]KNC71276.1 hypothetical protein SARC_16185 [Sphaeroforma arctica JP610]|eukprot:XP_014145178.1 hypothetical protein SARC_16185 [Sphaeroforma arctica JP610]